MLANACLLDFSFLSPVVLSVFGKREIYTQTAILLYWQRVSYSHILKEKGDVVRSWWFIRNCSAQVSLLVEHLWGKLQHHRWSLPCSPRPQHFHAGVVTANTHSRSDMSSFPSPTARFLIPTYVTASQSIPFQFPFPFTVPLALQDSLMYIAFLVVWCPLLLYIF